MADIATFQRCFMRAKFSESLDFVRLRRFIFFCRISLCDCRPALFCMLQTPRHRPLIGSSRRQHDLHWVDLIYGWLYVFSTLYGISTHFEPSTFRAHHHAFTVCLLHVLSPSILFASFCLVPLVVTVKWQDEENLLARFQDL